ncbi:uncharacterized protein LOC120289337 [Eucalyptus grandis]|uniref:Uncharacterized protein n=1 Tax=Eucalyptus globulus TaxID=34317 RepID=A0ABD3IIY1_EUCGL|nr:uncharacterized protein LOC120289337 [Eucalyptus grandis]
MLSGSRLQVLEYYPSKTQSWIHSNGLGPGFIPLNSCFRLDSLSRAEQTEAPSSARRIESIVTEIPRSIKHEASMSSFSSSFAIEILCTTSRGYEGKLLIGFWDDRIGDNKGQNHEAPMGLARADCSSCGLGHVVTSWDEK